MSLPDLSERSAMKLALVLAALVVAAPMVIAQDDLWNRKPSETTIETQAGVNPPAQAFLTAMNADSGAYYHVFHVSPRERPYSVSLRVGTPVYPRLYYTWSAKEGCLYWDDEGVAVQVRLEEIDCRLVLGGLVNRAWDKVEPKQPYAVMARRIGIEVYEYPTNTYCRFSFRRPNFHGLARQPATLMGCLDLFFGLVGRQHWTQLRNPIRPWTP